MEQFTVYSKILQLIGKVKSKKHCQLLHGRLIVDGLASIGCFTTRLLISYAKIGEIGTARKLFDQMSERSADAWTALISGYSQNGDNQEALRVFSLMHGQGTSANQFTYCIALSACTCLMWLELGNQIHGCLQKSRFAQNMFVQSVLVHFHSKCGKIEDAFSVFESMKIRDLASWNAMIGAYAFHGMYRNAVLVFFQMLGQGIHPDSFSFGNLLKAASRKDSLATVRIIHGLISQFGLESHRFVSGSLIDAYIKSGSLSSAHNLYESLESMDVVSCTTLIKGYASEGTNPVEGLRLFVESHRNIATDGMLLCSMLSICAKTASLSLGKQLHAKMVKYQFQNDTAMENALIDMYSKSGEIGDARRAFDEMETKNVVSWTSLIAACSIHGCGREAFELYAAMESEGLKPNDVTLLSLLSACSHSGLTAKAWRCFATIMIKHRIVPRAEHFSCLVDILARGGHLEEAYHLVHRLHGAVELEEGEATVLSAILGACSTYDSMALGKWAAQRLFCIQPENAANYVALSGIYAAAGLWNDVGETRKMMGRVALKGPGYSLCISS